MGDKNISDAGRLSSRKTLSIGPVVVVVVGGPVSAAHMGIGFKRINYRKLNNNSWT